MAQQLNSRQLLAEATAVLTSSEYVQVPVSEGEQLNDESFRVFEDAYGIVAIHVYETWGQLIDMWNVAQGHLVELISDHLTRPEPKAWEGYLVLLTPGLLPPSDRIRISDLRYDTNRVRKLVATGDDLSTLGEVTGILRPLLPLLVDPSTSSKYGLLERLPDLLSESNIPNYLTKIVVTAFQENDSIIERIHQARILL